MKLYRILIAATLSGVVAIPLGASAASSTTAAPPAGPDSSLEFSLTTPQGELTPTAESGMEALPDAPIVESVALEEILTTPAPSEQVETPVEEFDVQGSAGPAGSMSVIRPSAAQSASAVPGTDSDLAPTTTTADLVVLTEAIESGEFAVAALTWPAGQDVEGTTIHLRVREGGEWSAWLPLEADLAGAEGEARAGTDPFVTGIAEAVQVQINGAPESLPSDLKLEVFALPAPSTPAPMSGGMSVPAQIGPAPVAGDPGVITRERWGADPITPRWIPRLVSLEGAVVHHTAGSNAYAASDSARLVRNIHHYHANIRGWGDIGYNFLVDKYGQMFEGRDRSYDAPWSQMSVGAHAAPRNTNTLGISVMGDYTRVAPTSASLDAVVKVLQWRFNAAGIDGRGTFTFSDSSSPSPRIVGHNYVASTACPGPYISNWLPTLRTRVGGLPANWSSFRDVNSNDSRFVQQINWMKASGISTGWSDSTFRPQQSTTRAEFAAFMYRFAGSPAVTLPQRSPFTDIEDHTFYKQIVWLASTGITEGWPDGTFRPQEPILRDAVAAFIHRYHGLVSSNGTSNPPNSTRSFKDVPSSHRFANEIYWLAALGITTGWDDGTFRPDRPVNREQIAAFLFRYQEKFI